VKSDANDDVSVGYIAKKDQMPARYVTRSNITLNLGTVNCSSFQKETTICAYAWKAHWKFSLLRKYDPREIRYCCSRLKRLETNLTKCTGSFCRPRLKSYESMFRIFNKTIRALYWVSRMTQICVGQAIL